MSRTLSLYEVKIDWHYKGKPNQPPPPGLKLMPTLSVVFLKAEPNLGVNNSNEESYFSATLTHLRLLPQSLDYSTSKQLNPSVFALYSITTTSPDASFATQSRSTRLVQIVIDQSSRNLHPDFEKLRPTVTKASSVSDYFSACSTEYFSLTHVARNHFHSKSRHQRTRDRSISRATTKQYKSGLGENRRDS